MAYKVYAKGNYFIIESADGVFREDHKINVRVSKNLITDTTYYINMKGGVKSYELAELTDESGNAYTKNSWETFAFSNSGFSSASGGSGAGTTITVVSNYSALPSASSNSNQFYWVSNPQGTKWLPGSLGGNYYSNGMYYSNGTSWEYVITPYQATLNEVDSATNTDKFVTPYTFDNASKWSSKLDANSSINALNDVNITNVTNGQLLQYNFTTSQWENESITIGTGDMQKTTYDTDNDGIVDYSETVPVVVRNNSSVDTLRKGTIVYLSGSTGWRPNAIKAQANAESTSSGTFGAVIDDIAPNSDGLVAAMGTLHDLDTRSGATYPFTADTLVDGDALWLDPNNAGYVTKTKPQAPNHIVFIGIVARTSPTLGRIIYRIVNGFELDELHNVKIDSGTLANNDIIQYNSATSLWENKQPSSGGSFIPNLTASSIAGGYYANNGSATFSVMGNVSAAALSGTASAISITNTSIITRTIRTQIPTSATAGSKAGIRTASLRHSVGQGFSFSVGWCIQDAAYVSGAKQFHGLLPISTLSTISNTVDVSSLVNFIGVGSDALDTNLQIFYNDASGTASKIDLGANFPANRTVGAALDKFYVFDLYNEHDSMEVKYRITDRVTGNVVQGTLTTDLPLDTVLLAPQSIRTNGASALATVTQWSHLITYSL
jgi:hypothetical protein